MLLSTFLLPWLVYSDSKLKWLTFLHAPNIDLPGNGRWRPPAPSAVLIKRINLCLLSPPQNFAPPVHCCSWGGVLNVFLTSSTRTKLLAAWETALLLYTPLFSHQPLTHTSSPTHSPSHLLGSIDDTSVVPKLERSNGSNGNSIDKGCCDFLWKKKKFS